MIIRSTQSTILACSLIGLLTILVLKFNMGTVNDGLNQIAETANKALAFSEEPRSGGEEHWLRMDPETLSAEQIFRYLHWTNSSACQVPYDFGGKVTHLIGKSGIDGQKTVCMDPTVVPEPKNCLVYSFGINNEWSFDRMFEDYGCQIYAFDPSMSQDDGDFTTNIHFQKIGLAGADNDNGINGWKIRTLSSLYQLLKDKHGPKIIDYLKIDIEFSEWQALPQMLESGMLDHVRQMGVEVHFSAFSSLADYRNGFRILQNLEKYGMVRFTSRVNIWMTGHVNVLNAQDNYGYEIAWYNQKLVR